MRWPFSSWLRGASGRDDPAPGADADAPSAERDAAPGPSVRGPGAEARRAAWRDLPAVQRTVGAAPLTAPSTAFARDLASRDAPDPILRPLGHDVTADGPAGLVSGIAVPLVQRALAVPGSRATPALPSPAAPARGRPTAQRGSTTVAALPLRGATDAGHESIAHGSGLEEALAEVRADAALDVRPVAARMPRFARCPLPGRRRHRPRSRRLALGTPQLLLRPSRWHGSFVPPARPRSRQCCPVPSSLRPSYRTPRSRERRNRRPDRTGHSSPRPFPLPPTPPATSSRGGPSGSPGAWASARRSPARRRRRCGRPAVPTCP